MIKTKTIKIDKAEILVLGGLPEDAKIALPDNVTCNGEKGSLIYKNKDGNPVFIPLPPCNWQPLGFLKDITEDVAKELLPRSIPHHTTKKPIWEDYTYYTNHPITNNRVFNTATKSLHSLVAANCKLENPLGEKPVLKTNIEDYDEFTFPTEDGSRKWREWEVKFKAWQAEQEKVFTNPFLLKKIS